MTPGPWTVSLPGSTPNSCYLRQRGPPRTTKSPHTGAAQPRPGRPPAPRHGIHGPGSHGASRRHPRQGAGHSDPPGPRLDSLQAASKTRARRQGHPILSPSPPGGHREATADNQPTQRRMRRHDHRRSAWSPAGGTRLRTTPCCRYGPVFKSRQPLRPSGAGRVRGPFAGSGGNRSPQAFLARYAPGLSQPGSRTASLRLVR